MPSLAHAARHMINNHHARNNNIDLLEEEELIIAVNELMINVSNSIQQEIRNDVYEVWTSIKAYIQPDAFVRHLQQHAIIIGNKNPWMQNLSKVTIIFIMLLWFIAIWYASLSFVSRSKEHRTNKNSRHCHNNHNHHNNRHGSDDDVGGGENKVVTDRGNSSLSESYTNNDEETIADDDLLFEQLWETSIQQQNNSVYHQLVLPPVCRYIRPSSSSTTTTSTTTTTTALLHHHRRTSSTKLPEVPHVAGGRQQQQGTATPNSMDAVVLTSQQQQQQQQLVPSLEDNIKSTSGDIDAYDNNSFNSIVADDNPILRLRRYIFEIYIFFGSIISFDYTTAGTTLFNWIDQLYKLHFQQQRQQQQQQPPEPPPSQSLTNGNDIVVNEEDTTATVKVASDNEMNMSMDETQQCTGYNGENDSTAMILPAESTTTTTTPTRPSGEGNDEKKYDETFGLKRQLYTIPHSPLHERQEQTPHEIGTETAKPNSVQTLTTITKATPTTLQMRPQAGIGMSSPNRTIDVFDNEIVDPVFVHSNTSAVELDPRKQQVQIPSMGAPEHRHIERFASDQYQYFDTITSNESLRQMSIEVPVPDKHDYVLGDEFLIDPLRCTPLLVFVNSRSGPQQGNLLITQLRRLLNPIQIWDLSVNGDPRIILESFLIFTRLRILVCGGDGTVAWIVTTMEKMKISNQRQYPPIAILPLGTGNDLSRILGWGGGYSNESLLVILEQISESYVTLLDHWDVTIDENKTGSTPKKKGFFNYLGVGADAQAALQVHNLREIRPQWFFSRLVNKAMYGIFGAEDILKATTVHVRKDIQLYADGVRVPLPHDSQGIIILNIDSYAGGVPLWSHGVAPPSSSDNVVNTNSINRVRSFSEVEQYQHHHPIDKKWASQDVLNRDDSIENIDVRNPTIPTEEEQYAQVTSCNVPCSSQDGFLDIVSIRGAFHLGQIKVGLSNAQRLCQCREATIVIRNKVAVQVDGEPWRQNPCTIKIRRKPEQAVMLHRSADDDGVEAEMSKLLEWAEARKMIDSRVHTLLMKEFSRRIESKTRQRRAAAVARQQQDSSNFMHFTSTIKKAISSGAMA